MLGNHKITIILLLGLTLSFPAQAQTSEYKVSTALNRIEGWSSNRGIRCKTEFLLCFDDKCVGSNQKAEYQQRPNIIQVKKVRVCKRFGLTGSTTTRKELLNQYKYTCSLDGHVNAEVRYKRATRGKGILSVTVFQKIYDLDDFKYDYPVCKLTPTKQEI